MLCNTSPSHRVDQVDDCGLWNIDLQWPFNGRNWNRLSTPIQGIPNMWDGWHVQWTRTGMLSASWKCIWTDLCMWIDPCNAEPSLILLQQRTLGSHQSVRVFGVHNVHMPIPQPPPPPRAYPFTLTSVKRSPPQSHTRCLKKSTQTIPDSLCRNVLPVETDCCSSWTSGWSHPRPRDWTASVARCCVFRHTHFSLSLCCGQPEACLSSNPAVWSVSWYATPEMWVDYLG